MAILEQAGGDDPLLAQALVDLAEVLRMQRRVLEAEPYALRAVGMRERIYGREHPEVALALIAVARCRSGQRDAATDLAAFRAVKILDAAPAYPEACADAHAVRAARVA